MQRYEGKTVVVKYGGHAMGDAELGQAFARDIALLKQSKVNPIVVHGGGPQIASMLKNLGIEMQVRGRPARHRPADHGSGRDGAGRLDQQGNRRADQCRGRMGHRALRQGRQHGLRQEGRTRPSKDPGSNIERVLDLGFVGEPVEVDRTLLDLLARSEMIPVIAPVAPGRDGATYNINADTFAGAIAGSLGAKRLLFLTDVDGVLDTNKKLIPELTVREAKALIADGTISGGMIPKVETCLEALENGVEGVVILNGKTPHVVLVELFTEHGAGTLIVR